MTPHKPLALLTLSTLIAGLCGCADYAAYRKCASGCPGDADLDASLRALLAEHRELAAPNQVYVRTLDRVVYLDGQVATGLQRDTAESIVREAPGVRRVVDTIAISYGGR
jgi:osmotically-inducible protein OsmY